MKRLHSLLLTALSLLAACDPSPPPSAPGGWQLETSSLRVDPLTGNNTSFPDQSVCGSTPEQLITVHNDETSARQISFAEAAEPFVLTAIQNPSGTRVGLPFAPVTLNPGKSMSFFVKFSPRIPKAHTGFLTVYSDAPLPLQIPLSGKGTGPRLELSVSSLTLSLPAAPSDAGVSDDGGTSPSSTATDTIRLTNSGNAPLTSLSLSRVDSSFSVRISKTVTTSEPLPVSGTVDLEVTFNPTSTARPIITDTLIIASDDPCAPASRIALTGFRTAGPAPVVTPTTLTFAEQEVGTISPPQSVKVFNEGGSALTVDSLSLLGTGDAGTPFVVSPSGAFSLAPGESRDLLVKFSPTEAGSQDATLQLASSGGGSLPPVALSGDAVAAAPLTLGATSIAFSNLSPGQPQTRMVTVTNPGPSPLTINAAVSSPETSLTLGVDPASFTLASHDSRTLVVTATASTSAATGSWSGQLTLSSGVSSPTRQTTITLTGNTVRTRLELSDTTLSFADQLVGATAQQKGLVLTNRTALPITVYDVPAGSLSPFSVKGLPKTLPANSSDTVTVSFDPASRKLWTATLQLTSDAPDAIAPVTLSGKAIAPVLSADSSSLDFGTQAPGTRTSRSVTLTNSGDASLSLDGAALLLDKAPFTLEGLNPPQLMEPGDSLPFKVSYNPSGLGLTETTLQFYAGGSSIALPSPQLKLRGLCSGPLVRSEPGDPFDFGPQRVGEPAVIRKVRITNDQDATETLEIVSIGINDATPQFNVVGTYAGTLLKKGTYIDVVVSFKPTVVGTSYKDGLTLIYRGTTTGVATPMSLALQGTGATSLLDIDPYPSVAFGAVEVGQAGSTEIQITNKGDSPLKLSSISIEGLSPASFLLGALSWPKELAKNQTEKIPISFVPTKLDAVTASLVITSNATSSNVDSTGKTTLLLSGRGAAAKALFATRTLGFGEVPIGQTALRTLRITNTGSSALRINEPTPSAHFKLLAPPTGTWPVSIPNPSTAPSAPDNFFDFQIAFTPDSQTPVSESLTFTSNDPDPATSATVISVLGTGTLPQLTVKSSLYFGPALIGTEMSALLPLQNDGKAPLVLKTLTVTAPFCVVPPGSTGCVQLASGESLASIDWKKLMNLELRVTPRSPKLVGRLTLTTNEGAGNTAIKEVALLVGEDGVSIQDPSDSLVFGACAMEGNPILKGVNLWNTSKMDDAVTSVAVTGPDAPDFSVMTALVPPLAVPALGGAELKLSFKPKNGAAGVRNATAYIYTMNRRTPLKLNLQGVATGPFSGFKDFQWTVDFGTQRLSEKKEPVRFPLQNQLGRSIYVRTYGLEGNQKDDFKLEVDRACHLESTSQEIEIRAGETCDLLLSYVAQRERLSSADLVLEAWTRVGEPPIPVTRARLEGEMVSSFLAVDPPEVVFDWVDRGQPVEPQLITVTNRSAVATRVLNPQVTGAEEFTVEALEPGKELPPAGTTQLRVMFQPKMAGEPEGQLLLRLQGDEATDVAIPLRGHVWEVNPEGGGCSTSANGGAILWAGGLLLMVLGRRRRSHKASP